MSRTNTIAITRTHTATYIGAKIAAAFRDILVEIGLGAEALNLTPLSEFRCTAGNCEVDSVVGCLDCGAARCDLHRHVPAGECPKRAMVEVVKKEA